MNGSKKTFLLVEGAKLKLFKDNHLCIQVNRQRFQIVKGIIYNQNQKPCVGAVVQVVQINCNDKSRSLLGYVLADEYGEYLFAIEAKSCMKYELSIYAPLM
jgi:hypothetical protein